MNTTSGTIEVLHSTWQPPTLLLVCWLRSVLTTHSRRVIGPANLTLSAVLETSVVRTVSGEGIKLSVTMVTDGYHGYRWL